MESTDADREMSTTISEWQRMQDVKIRNEFLCPITYDLLRDPVVCSDGHTYERSAIEKWIKSNDTSPLTGAKIERALFSNMTMKKLIFDLIIEGGKGLYVKDESNEGRLVDIRPELVQIWTCLGPSDSDWNRQSFQVGFKGAVGGRHVSTTRLLPGQEVVNFRETTISRQHFEISKQNDGYSIRDLGSAGGTFIRISYGTRKALHPGMIFLVGKHQFLVSSIDQCVRIADSKATEQTESRFSGVNDLLKEVTSLLSDMSVGASGNDEKNISDSMKLVKQIASNYAEMRLTKSIDPDYQIKRECLFNNNIDAAKPEVKDQKGSDDVNQEHADSEMDRDDIALTITCFTPDSSPLQGKSFSIENHGATIGRDPSNSIGIYMTTSSEGSESKMVSLDSAISKIHARIELDLESGQFYLYDGTPEKASLNGTWVRLSGPHQESPCHRVVSGMEILVGTLRFQVSETMIISEQTVMGK